MPNEQTPQQQIFSESTGKYSNYISQPSSLPAPVKSKEGILRKYLLKIYNNEQEMDDNLCNHYEEIYAAMEEYRSQSIPVEKSVEEILKGSMFMNGGNTDQEKAFYKFGFLDGHSTSPSQLKQPKKGDKPVPPSSQVIREGHDPRPKDI